MNLNSLLREYEKLYYEYESYRNKLVNGNHKRQVYENMYKMRPRTKHVQKVINAANKNVRNMQHKSL